MRTIISIGISLAFGFLVGFPFGISYTVTAAQDSYMVNFISNLKAVWEFLS
ncbi:hypothetical protein PP657_gp030 [Bacillus phage BCPST]|uniref:Uncharacterized protein n=3 Tax=Yihwangvirus TaxID=3044863 RepID=A0AAE7P5M9_9CAUD|nr:hypothetical protein PP655_gp064 [Bacillus phage PBC4]YP_010657229.1 hypothetical protein PP656_gp047 [Bacillus phage pW4]YP_010657283.1 hypothetical protein PP657_gp030 [Bacillus phage BCPST]QSJ04238.1 hypothetical protein BCP6_033 [Bacillus phage BCP6]AKQ08256.1 hypothetical protein PBC4_064 [Bacillus phage PBC4]AZU99107.1 hypothetical protein pW4_92 [Bacillus phage pW4]QQO38648.1 hypothetical protein BCPST_030 [Bacillus phage BCPST]